MRNIKDGHSGFAIEACEQLQNFRLRNHVERAGGFIGEKRAGRCMTAIAISTRWA